jgi:bifunctional enzyme CysN/CysC
MSAQGLLRLATAGSVDDGKSTLIGRLLLDSKQILVDQMEAMERASRARGDAAVDLALLTDGLRAEREQGITIDVAYRYFTTPRRSFVLADTPGHPQYTRNMATGVSNADLALILVDARKGVIEQSRRHAFIASLMGVPHFIVCVNKMDLVGFDEAIFERICDQFREFAARLEVHDITFVPVSALDGDNVVETSPRMPWYGGPPLLYHLEHVEIAADRNLVDCRFPVQWVIRPRDGSEGRRYAGQMAGGILRPGEQVIALPSEQVSRVASLSTYDGPLDAAFPPMSITVALEDELDLSRGEMLCRPANRPQVTRDLDATVCWMHETPLEVGGRYALKQTTRTVAARVDRLEYRIDVHELHRDPTATRLELNDIGRVRLRTAAPLFVDDYRRNRLTGSFILIDESTNDTVAAGIVVAQGSGTAAWVAHSPNVVWQQGSVSREQRWAALGQRGATLWLTGLPGAGKTTIATALEERLVERGHHVYVLDGDNLRHGLNSNLGFDAAARTENVRRAAEAARLLADAGAIVVVSLISPYQADRAQARSILEAADLAFLEVFVDTPLAECERRDPKGLYARARRGEIRGFTGVDDPYEAPEAPDAQIRTVGRALEEELEDLERLLTRRGLLGRGDDHTAW